MTRDGSRPTLWAISDLHTGHTGNKPITESLYPASADDWLIVAGDVGERTDEIRWALDLLRKRFAKVIWVPGNHELWTTNRDPMQIFGKARYDYLVNMCDEMGIITPEHPFPVWTEEGGPATIVPMFLLYDYTFLPAGRRDQGRGAGHRPGTQRGRHRRVPAVLRALRHPRRLVPRPGVRYPQAARGPRLDGRRPCWSTTSRWCASPATRCSTRSSRCGAAPPRPPTGTRATTLSVRSTATCTSRAPPGTTVCGIEEVSVGYPREWRRRKPYRWLRQILPDPKYAPGYLNEFGGHFQITQEMRDHAEKVQERTRARQS